MPDGTNLLVGLVAEVRQQRPDGVPQRLVAQVRVVPARDAGVGMPEQLGNDQQVGAGLREQ